jgi:Tripartite tricarboxylate transporter TctB family
MAFIRHPKDFFSGLIFVAFGLAAIIIGSNYSLGTAARMGPGYFPRILGILLVVLGTALSLRALKIKGDPLPRWYWKPMLVVLGSVIAFGLVVTHLGLVFSTIGLIFASSAASPEFRPKEALISGILLAALAVGVFIFGLNLQLPIWPWSN